MTEIIDKTNVIEHSKSWKKVIEINESREFDTRNIQLRALNFLNNDCLGSDCYDKEKKAYMCKPFTIRGKEATIKYLHSFLLILDFLNQTGYNLHQSI